mgnify:FL=1
MVFNQDVKFTKGTILQQYNDSDVVGAFGTIVETPVGEIATPGLGTTYKIGKIYPAGATFNTTDKFKTTTAADTESNVISDIVFTAERVEAEWKAATAYTAGDVVYANGKFYAATTNATSGQTRPSHSTGNQSDGGVSWDLSLIHI